MSPAKKPGKNKPSDPGKIATLPVTPSVVEDTPRLPFPVVGVGASAGGLDAFMQLLKALEPRLGMAFVLVPHLDPSHESAMSELLSRGTKMPVLQVTDGIRVKADHVYVIPPNSEMTISRGVLQLATRPQGLPYMPIDTFLRSLALDQSANAIGVILSGTASDGTLGLTAIKGEGGITFAQDPDSAKYDGMPNSAIAAGCVDFVLAPAGISVELARIRRHPYIAETRDEKADELRPESSRNLAHVFQLLRQTHKVDFSDYKPATIRRRVFRRMALRKIVKLGDYVDYLRQRHEEIDALYQDILINVTSFFRNPEAFEALKQVVYPAILKARSPNEIVRIWVPGCSTGEEAYSHAIALIEHLSDVRSELPIQIFGTDLSEIAIQKARAGVYKDSIRADVSSTRLRRFFNKTEEGYQISKSIRDMCIFATQNVFDDPPFSRMDLVSCRNVLIYMGPSLQKRVIPVFHYALNPTGFLMVGDTEGLLGAGTELFDLVDKKHKIYRKKAVPSPVAFGFSMAHYRGANRKEAALPAAKGADLSKVPADLQREADRLLLAKYVPAAVVVNEHLDILQTRGHTGTYLELSPGKASLNLLKMLRPGLLFELQKGMESARKNHTTVRKEDLEFESNGSAHRTHIEIIPFKTPPNDHENFVIVFEDAAAPSPRPIQTKAPAAPPDRRGKDRQIVRLKEELAAAKEYLQSIIEAHEATNEELQSANEEIQSGNEELQSTNEELQTSKEELESANEELNTVNDEMQHRNQQLTLVNNDLTNLLNSVNIPTVMLGPDLSIRRFTPQAEKVLGFTATDVGRPITHFRSRIKTPDLEQTLLDVIHEITPKQLEVQDSNGGWYRLRIMPYRTAENKIEGAVLTLLDMSDIKQSQEDLASQLGLLEQALKQMPCGVLITEAPLGKLLRTSAHLEQILGGPLYPAAGVQEYSHFQALHPNGKPYQPEEWPMAHALKGQTVNANKITWVRSDGKHVALLVSSSPLLNSAGEVAATVSLFLEDPASDH